MKKSNNKVELYKKDQTDTSDFSNDRDLLSRIKNTERLMSEGIFHEERQRDEIRHEEYGIYKLQTRDV